MLMRKPLVLTLFVGVMLCPGSSTIAVQESDTRQERKNETAPKRTVLPEPNHRVLPDYPTEPAKARVGRSVSVEITVDEDGIVTEAIALTGDPRLRAATVKAARAWKFEPALLDGKPSKFVGLITFCFLAKSKTVRSTCTFSFMDCCPRNLKKRRSPCAEAI
jgi:TonB family protein